MEIKPEQPSPLLRLLFLVPFILLAFFIFARHLHKTAQSQPPVNEMMPFVRTYGLGLSAPAFVHPVVPSQEAWRYRDDIRALFLAEKFTDLERIAETNRDDPSFLLGGVWKSYEFFNAITPVSFRALTDADYQSYIEKARRWQQAFPESSAARISLADLYIDFASFARGTGYANSVSDQQWQAFNERNSVAQQVLLDAAQLREHDPAWFQVMLYLAQNAGWTNGDTHELFDRALAIQPTNYHLYRACARYLLPQWYGATGDIQRLAEEAAARNSEPTGSTLYFQAMGELACYCESVTEQLASADWKKLKIGYANLVDTYGHSNYTANQYAAMAAVFDDKEAAREAFKNISFRDTGVWMDEKSFNFMRDWANSSDGP